MKRNLHFSLLGSLATTLLLAIIAVSSSHAQATIGAGDGKNVVSVGFYKVPSGKQDEWLALYRKYHLPIMKYLKEHGQVISETVYTRAIHQVSPDYDFAIVIVTPPSEKTPKSELSRSQIIRKLFPDVDDYVKGEKSRWALTVQHWDEKWTEVDIDNHPSLYEPF
jgi:hypothetical protein